MSHARNVEAFDWIMGICTGYGESYKPGSSNLQLPSMTAKLLEARRSMEETYSAQTLVDNATNSREVAFREMRQICTRAFGVLQSFGADPLTLEDALSRLRRIRGRKRSTVDRGQLLEGESTTEVQHRASGDRNFTAQMESFARFVETLVSASVYAPNESELTVESLGQLLARLQLMNKQVMEARVKLAQARKSRNAILYLRPDNLVQTGYSVKAYLKGVFGARSPQYQEVRKIRFSRS